MRKSGSIIAALYGNGGADQEETPQRASNCRFYPIKGSNASIQAIVEGNLLAQIELESIPEYGLHLGGEAQA